MMNEGMLIRFVNRARNILFTALGKFQINYYYEIKLVFIQFAWFSLKIQDKFGVIHYISRGVCVVKILVLE